MEQHKPSQNINVALLPLDIRLGDVRHNLSEVEQRICALPPEVDLVVLPELFNTGFDEFPESIDSFAEADDGPTVASLKRLSAEHDVAIAGGFIGKRGGRYYNRAVFVDQGEPLAFYNKRHLFAGAESKLFTRGNMLSPIVEFKTWRLRLSICYDLRFPVWNRSVGNDYDVLLLMANWPGSRYYAWKHLVIARAIENQCYACACNREGEDYYGSYRRGDSMIVDAMGQPIGMCYDDGTVMATLDCEAFNADRQRLKPWRMADEFTLRGVTLSEE